MAERFSRLYTLPKNLYADDAPVIIAAGALLKDNQTGNRLAQLKIQNIDKRTIVSIKLRFVLLDASERIIREHYHTFSDITVTEKDYFGSKTPVVLPVPGVCSFTVSIVEVTFSEGPQWRSGGDWNTLSENTDIDALKTERDIRVQEMLAKDAHERAVAEEIRAKKEAEEQAAREREEAERIAIENQRKAEQRKKAIRISSVTAIILVIIVASVLIWMASPQYMVKKAIYYMERGDFGGASISLEEAEHELTEKDIRSADKSAIYQYAEYLSTRSFSKAISVYKLIPDYEDALAIANAMQSMLDKYVGEYECISSKMVEANGDTEVKDLKSNISIYDLKYNIVESGEINMISSDDGVEYWGFSKQNENESILEAYEKSNDDILGYEFSPDGKILTYTLYHEFIIDTGWEVHDDSLTFETVWQKTS